MSNDKEPVYFKSSLFCMYSIRGEVSANEPQGSHDTARAGLSLTTTARYLEYSAKVAQARPETCNQCAGRAVAVTEERGGVYFSGVTAYIHVP